MKSRRSWLIGLALGAALFFGTPSAKAQTVPRGITYQGLLLQNGAPFNGNVTMDFVITDLANNKLFEQTNTGLMVTDGVFNVVLGDPAITPAGIPNTILFDKQYQLIITVNSGTPLPVQFFWSAPYALNAQRVGGLDVSPTPVNGDIFPMPLNGIGQISPTMLPPIPDNALITAPVTTVNNLPPDANGNIVIVGGTGGITVTNSGNTVTINNTSTGGAITGVFGDNGVTGGGRTGDIYLSIAPGGITHGMLANGAVTGQDITGIAGAGLSQDASGLLDVQVDNVTIGIEPPNSLTNPNELYVLPGGIGTVQLANGSVTGAKIAPNTITSANVNGTIQLAPISPAPAGSFLTSIAQSGATTSGTVLTNSTLTDAITPPITGPNLTLGINLANPNTWTGQQNFSGSSATIPVQISNTGGTALAVTLGLSTFTGITNVGTLTETGNETVSGTLTVAGNSAIGNTNTALLNSFGTGGNANSVINTYGSTGALSTNTFNGASTFTSTLSSVGNTTLGTGAATTNTFGAGAGDLNTFGNATGTNTVVGTTNINTTGSDATTIGNLSAPLSLFGSTDAIQSATTNTVTVGTAYSLTTGTTWSGTVGTIYTLATGTSANINVTGSGATNIGNVASTTTVTGPTNINTSGASTTTIGSLGNNALTINAATTHNGTTAFNNNVTQTAGTAQFLNTQVNGNLGVTGTITSNTAGDNFSGSTLSGGTPTLTVNNSGGGNSLTISSGLATIGTQGTDGQKLVINGLTRASGGPQFEFVVNGDASITGDLNVGGALTAGSFTATTIVATTSVSSPQGNFDNLSTYTAGNTQINVNRGLNQTGGTTNLFSGPVSANAGVTSTTGTVAITGNETVSGTLGVTGATTLTTLTTSGVITDNANSLIIGTPGGALGNLTVNQTSNVGSPFKYTFPDSSGTVALLQNIAQIQQGTIVGQTLWWNGTQWAPSTNISDVVTGSNNSGSGTVTFNTSTLQDNAGATNIGGTNLVVSTATDNFNSGSISFSTGTISDQDITTLGTAGFEGGGSNPAGTILTVKGVTTAWTSFPYTGAPGLTNPPTLPLTAPFISNDFESIIQGDQEVTGTLFTASEYASLNASSLLRFDHAEPFTLSTVGPNTMEFSGAGTLAGTPVVTFDNIPTGSWAQQVNGAAVVGSGSSATAAGGIQVSGFTNGTGILVDPTAVGINDEATQYGIVIGEQNPVDPITGLVVNAPLTGEAVVAQTFGETINMTTTNTGTGLTIGAGTTPLLGESIVAGTTGLNVTAPTSLNALGTANINITGGATTNIATTNTAITNIGVTGGTNNVLGTTNVNISGGSGTNIGNSGSTTTVVGPTNINVTGGATTNIATTNAATTNIGVSTGTNNILGGTNINTSGTALTTVGNAGTDQIWLTINGINTAGIAAPPAVPGISASQYELTDNGDAFIRGSLDAGQVVTGLLSAPNIAFNNAQSFSANTTMQFNSTSTVVPTVTINDGNTQYALQVNGPTGGAGGGGIQITGNGGIGTGLNIDPFPVGIAVAATTTGINITNSAASITATGTISSTGTTNGATGSVFTANNAAVTTLTVNNTNGSNAPALGVGGAFTSSGNSTVGTNAGTTNQFGNTGASTNNIGNGSGATNNIGNGGGATTNTIGGSANQNIIGSNATQNQVGTFGTSNFFGADATNNYFGRGATLSVSNAFGEANAAGKTTTNLFGDALAGATANNTFGSSTGTVTNTILGTTNINATTGSATNVGTGSGTNALGNITGSTTILGNPLNENAGVGLTTNIGTGAGTGGAINIGNTTSTTTIIGTLNANGQTTITSNSSPIFTVQTAGGAVATGIQVSLNGGTLTTGENINATTTDLSLTNAPTSVSATGTINTTGTSGQGSTFAGNSGATTTLQVTNANSSTTAPALGVSGAFTSTGNSTVATLGGTTNTFGNGGAGTGNTIGTSATSNSLGTNATNNFVGLNAVTNTFGNNTAGAGTVTNNLGNVVNAGGTTSNLIGASAAGGTATTTIGSTTGTVTNNIIGLTNINIVGSANTIVGNPANTAGQSAAFNGTVTMTGTGQATDELTIATVTPSQWGERITDNPASGNALGIIDVSTSTATNNATAGSLTATGGGATNTALSLTTSGVTTVASIGANVSVTGASTGPGTTGGNRGEVIAVNSSTTQNIGEDITVSGTNSTGVRVNAGPGTGISFDASNASTNTGEIISGIRNTGLDLTYTSGLNGVNGEVVDMTNAVGAGGAYNGIEVTNLNLSSNVGISIGYTTGGAGGTGLAIAMPNNGNGSGISLTNVASGSGIQVLGVSGAGYGMSVTGASSSGNIISTVNATGGKGIVTYADGTANTTALQVGSSGGNGGNVVSDGNGAGTNASPSNRWIDTYVLSTGAGSDQTNNHLTIYNSLVTNTSTIIITVEGAQTATQGECTVGNDAQTNAGFNNGHFDVYSTAGAFGVGVFKIHYMVVNH